jgi:Xaa-Pro aminopeptidase
MELGIADAYLLSSDINVRYASGFSGDSSELLITSGGVFFFTDPRYTLQAEKDMGDDIEIITTSAGERLPKIAHAVRRIGIGSIGVEKGYIDANTYEKYKETLRVSSFEDISGPLLRLRETKTDEEVEKISFAAAANDRVLEALVSRIKPGMSEFDVRAELVYQINLNGMDNALRR